MTKNATKKALLLSVLSMLLCMTMLVGTTYAWFTDSVTVGGNKIQSGKLDIKLYQIAPQDNYANEKEWVWEDITESTEPIFDYANWEPGYVEAVNLRIENVGTLAAKIKVNLVATSELSALADVIDVYMSYGPFVKTGRDNWIKENQKIGTLREVIEGGLGLNIPTTAEDVIRPQKVAGVRDGLSECYACFAFKMQETAGNEYQGMELGTFDIRVLATQATFEEDSFDNQYDKDASYAVSAPVDFNDGESHVVDLSNTDYIVSGADIADTLATIRVQGTSTATIAGNGTVKVTAEQGISNAMAVWARNGAQIVIEDGTFILERAEGNYNEVEMIYASGAGSTITIKGGTFKCNHPSKTLNIHNGSDAYIYVMGGTFWEFNPTVHEDAGKVIVPEGYKVVSEEKADGTWYTVVPN